MKETIERKITVDFEIVEKNGFINKSTMRKLFNAMYKHNHSTSCDYIVTDTTGSYKIFSFDRVSHNNNGYPYCYSMYDFSVYYYTTIVNYETWEESERETTYLINFYEKNKGTFDYGGAEIEHVKGEWY